MSDKPLGLTSKAVWRDWAKSRRAQLETEALSAKLCQHILGWSVFRQAKHILSYVAFGSELNVSQLQQTNKVFYITRTWERHSDLTVHPLEEGLEQHRYGYYQPPKEAQVIDPKIIDLVLVPGLCFDIGGTRLGYGKGYYDRLLPKVRAEVPRLAIASEALIVPELPKDSFDITMTHMATEMTIYSLPS